MSLLRNYLRTSQTNANKYNDNNSKVEEIENNLSDKLFACS